MKFLFLHHSFIASLRAYGVKLSESPTIDKISEILGHTQLSVVRTHSEALKSIASFKAMPIDISSPSNGFPCCMKPTTPLSEAVRHEDLQDAGIGRGTYEDLLALNCVVTADEVLIFYVDSEANEQISLKEKIVLAMGKTMTAASILESDMWSSFEKS